MRLPAPVAALGRAVSWHRRGLAAVLAAASVLALYSALRPSTADQVPVLVASRSIAAGQTADAGSLRIASVPRAVVPDQALTALDQAVGRTVTAGLTPNSILTDRDVLTPTRSADGTVVVPVRITDTGVAALLQPGDRVDLFARSDGTTDPGRDARLASGAVVVTVTQPADGPVAGVGGGTGDGALVLVRVGPSVAERLAKAPSSNMTIVFR